MSLYYNDVMVLIKNNHTIKSALKELKIKHNAFYYSITKQELLELRSEKAAKNIAYFQKECTLGFFED